MMLLFFLGFNIGTGSVNWVYLAEVTVDKAAGFCAFAQFGMGLVYTLTMEFMIHSKLQAHGTFLLFGAINLAGFFFYLFFVKETRGLSDKQKKSLYNTSQQDINLISGLEMSAQNQKTISDAHLTGSDMLDE